MCLKIHDNVTSDNDIPPVNPMPLLASLDAMDLVTQVNQMDTVDFAPIWCTDFERCKQQIGLRFGCVRVLLLLIQVQIFFGKIFQVLLKPTDWSEPVASPIFWVQESSSK